jgi:hypothetical protein
MFSHFGAHVHPDEWGDKAGLSVPKPAFAGTCPRDGEDRKELEDVKKSVRAADELP